MDEVMQTRRVQVASVEEAPWNVNVMPPDVYELLKADMARQGPEACDPIDTCELEGRKFTVDGAHRLRAAKELQWDHLYEIPHPELRTEEDARLFNYRRDSQRGQIDAFKLSSSLSWFRDRGVKLEQIGEMFGIDVSTVSRRLSLSKMEPEVARWSASKHLTISHLEVIAALPSPVQKQLSKDLSGYSEITVNHLENVAARGLSEHKERLKLQAWLQDKRVKFPVCPKCQGKPVGPGYVYTGGTGAALMPVRDANYHNWSLVNGAPKEERVRSGDTGRSFPQHFKSTVTPEVYAEAIANFCRKFLASYTHLESVVFQGTAGGKKVMLTATFYGPHSHIELTTAGDLRNVKPLLSFRFRKNEGKEKSFATYIDDKWRRLENKKDIQDLAEAAASFLQENSCLGRGKPRGREGSPKGKRAERQEAGRIVPSPQADVPKRKRGRPPKIRQGAT